MDLAHTFLDQYLSPASVTLVAARATLLVATAAKAAATVSRAAASVVWAAHLTAASPHRWSAPLLLMDQLALHAPFLHMALAHESLLPVHQFPKVPHSRNQADPCNQEFLNLVTLHTDLDRFLAHHAPLLLLVLAVPSLQSIHTVLRAQSLHADLSVPSALVLPKQ